MAGQRHSASGAIFGVRVRTLDPGRPFASAVAWRDGIIVAVGDDDEVRRECDAKTEVVEAPGSVVTPGLVDCHIHPFFIEQTRGADLTRCRSRSDLVASLREYRERNPDEEWVLGWGLEYGTFESEPITSAPILEAVGDVPAMLAFMDQHTWVATPAALKLAGVTGEERFDEAAEVVVGDSGLPTGELREQAAMQLVAKVVPELTDAEYRAASVDFLRRLNRVGITGVHIMNGEPAGFDFLRELEASGELSVRAVYPLWQKPEMSLDEMRAQLHLVGERGRRWRGGVAKFFIDGVIDSGTAWLYEPDSEGVGLKPFWPDPEHYNAAVKLFAEAGFQCATHAVGDRAVGAALDAYAAAKKVSAPHRIEHIETLTDGDLGRFVPQGVAASMQPLHMQWRKPDGSDSYASRIGPERTERGFPAASILGRGATVALGSDWPVAQFDPRYGMAWTRLRREPGQPHLDAFEPAQRLDAEATLAGYTTAAAAIVGESDKSGRIAPGMRADLTGFAADPVEVSGDELAETPITLTVVDGEVVWRK